MDWSLSARDVGTDKDIPTVSVMDGIMFEAQRQGRLSFYMVCIDCSSDGEALPADNLLRYLQVKRVSASDPQQP